MNPSRAVLAFVLTCCLLCPAALFGQAAATTPAPAAAPAAASTAMPFTMDKQYSADVTVLMTNGLTIQTKTFIDGDKMRSNVEMNGMSMATIIRKDQKKMYHILDAQKMVMVSDFDAAKFGGNSMASFGPSGKFDLIGPDTVDGVNCTKYKVTSDDGKEVYNFWVDTTNKVPVQMQALDKSFTLKWKNYKAGPQDAALFEVPAGYQVTAMPAMPGGMPGGGQ